VYTNYHISSVFMSEPDISPRAFIPDTRAHGSVQIPYRGAKVVLRILLATGAAFIVAGCNIDDPIRPTPTVNQPVYTPIPSPTEPIAQTRGIFGQAILALPVEASETTSAAHITAVRTVLATMVDGEKGCVRADPGLVARNPTTRNSSGKFIPDRTIVTYRGFLPLEEQASWGDQIRTEEGTDNLYQWGYVEFKTPVGVNELVVVPLDWVVPATSEEQELIPGDPCIGRIDGYP
jgi:hypothetical protein